MFSIIRGCFVLILASLAAGDVAIAAPPNVVLILSDDQGWEDYGFMGHPHILTPHLDRLASESIVFTRGYVPYSLCRPSLATLITGRYPHQHGIVGNNPPVPEQMLREGKNFWQARMTPEYLSVREQYLKHIDDESQLPELLAEHCGAISFQAGKWWEGSYSRGGFTHGMTHGDPHRGGRHGDAGLKIGREGMQPVLSFLQQAKQESKPFFLWYAPIMPHSPHNPPERLLKKYRDKSPHLEIAKYWAMCEWFDETIGELLGELDRLEFSDNTIVLYLADNGWINQPDADKEAPRSKRSQYDGGVRTPILIRWPNHAQPRRDETHLASSIDLVPTVLAAAGIPVPKNLPGINLLDDNAVGGRHQIYGEIHHHDIPSMTDSAAGLRYRWIIEDEWKLIVPNQSVERDGQLELFNIVKDPHELQDLAREQSERVNELRSKLDVWWTPKT